MRTDMEMLHYAISLKLERCRRILKNGYGYRSEDYVKGERDALSHLIYLIERPWGLEGEIVYQETQKDFDEISEKIIKEKTESLMKLAEFIDRLQEEVTETQRLHFGGKD